MGLPGRPRLYPDAAEARRQAARRASERAKSSVLSQRTVLISREAWARLRAIRQAGETSDSKTLERLILSTG